MSSQPKNSLAKDRLATRGPFVNGAFREGLAFDDVLLEPAASDVLPTDVDVRSRLTRQIKLNIRFSPRRWTR